MLGFHVRSASPSRYRRRVQASLAVVAAAVSLGSTQAAKAGGAFGGGVAIVGSDTEFFECNVKATGDGNAKGNIKYAQRDERGVRFVSHLRADCIHFLDERTAIVACTVVNDTDPEFVGTTATFTVRDNGNGPNAPPDEFTGVYFALNIPPPPGFDGWTCEAVLDFLSDPDVSIDDFLAPFGPGNIHVRP